MKSESLQQHIRELACLDETKEPVVSCYVNLTEAHSKWRDQLRRRFDCILKGSERRIGTVDMTKIIGQIWRYLSSSAIKGARGAAIFARNGNQSLWLPLKFLVPLPTWASVDTLPNIYPLIELKDRYQRYIVLLSTKDSARIYEIVLGEISKELWVQRPTLRKRVGREWTRMHYQNHRRERGLQFLRVKIDILEHLVSSDGPASLILAGDPRIASEIRSALPRQLAVLVTDIVPMGRFIATDQVVASTLQAFIAAEEQESTEIVKRFMDAFYKHDLAVVGVAESLQSLLRHQADLLLISQEADLGRSRYCLECGWAVAGNPLPETCMECGGHLSGAHDSRTDLVRLAESDGRPVEIVKGSKQFDALGGAGCILRYALSAQRSAANYGRIAPTRTHIA